LHPREIEYMLEYVRQCEEETRTFPNELWAVHAWAGSFSYVADAYKGIANYDSALFYENKYLEACFKYREQYPKSLYAASQLATAYDAIGRAYADKRDY